MDPNIASLVKDFGVPTGTLIVVLYVLYLVVAKLFPLVIDVMSKRVETQDKELYGRFDALIEAFKQGVLGVDAKIDGVSKKLDEHHGVIVEKLDKIDGKVPEKKKEAGGS